MNSNKQGMIAWVQNPGSDRKPWYVEDIPRSAPGCTDYSYTPHVKRACVLTPYQFSEFAAYQQSLGPLCLETFALPAENLSYLIAREIRLVQPGEE